MDPIGRTPCDEADALPAAHRATSYGGARTASGAGFGRAVSEAENMRCTRRMCLRSGTRSTDPEPLACRRLGPRRGPARSLGVLLRDGVAIIESAAPVTAATVFGSARSLQTVTAVAVMQLQEQGLIDLEAPANEYLRGFQLMPAKASWGPATVRHLLTHTAGVPEWLHPSRMIKSGWFAESFALGERLPSLAEYYRGSLRLAAEPGTIWAYTDHGFATLGQMVEDVSGQPLHSYLRERILEPLGMIDTDLLRSQRLTSRLATGYRLRSGGAVAVTDRQGVTAAAGSIYSTPRDMARYVAALLGGGFPQLAPTSTNTHPRDRGSAAPAPFTCGSYQAGQSTPPA